MYISQKELKVLEKFLQPKVVENEEEAVLDEYRGWIHYCIKFNGSAGTAVKVVSTAHLTSLGKRFVQRAMILRSPWKRFLYKLVNIPAGG